MELLKVDSEFWDYQATVTEDGIIAKVMREEEDRSKGYRVPFDHISIEENQKLDRYELIAFFMPMSYPKIRILMAEENPRKRVGRATPSPPDMSIT